MNELVWINTGDDTTPFPDVGEALRDPDGLLAVGGDLSLRRLLAAYRQGIFPWYSEGQPVLWWSPNPRTILDPRRLHISRSLRKTLRSRQLETSMDRDFEGVIDGCSGPRSGQPGTWITRDMKRAYGLLHRCGFAHSVEVWQDGTLAGGLYGVAIGGVFFGESMFSRESNASKIALVALCERLCAWSFRVIDCQMHTEHLARMGAEQISRQQFLKLLAAGQRLPHHGGRWSLDGCTSWSKPSTDKLRE